MLYSIAQLLSVRFGQQRRADSFFTATLLALGLLLSLSGCAVEQTEVTANEPQTAMVSAGGLEQLEEPFPAALAMPDRYSANAVEQVLREGGNAIDAAVTAAFVLAVTFPEAGNIGGGGFLLARVNEEFHFLDYREKAPAAANRDMFVRADGTVGTKDSLVGIRAAGVPGTVAGLWEAHQKFGTKPWGDLIAPAIMLADQGFMVHEKTSAEFAWLDEWFGDQVNFMEHFGTMRTPGLFRQPELADTLRRISAQGPEDFYAGTTARLMVAQMQRNNGLITLQDLAAYQPVWRAPLAAQWRGRKVLTAPPPSSGGFALINLLKMKELLDGVFAGVEHNSSQYVHLVAEMEKRVFADRAEYFGDPDFFNVPIAELTSDAYIQRRAGEVKVNDISQPEDAQPGLESPSTTHFSIIDRWGNTVSNTYTLNWGYGSGVVVEGAGFILNNEMDDFSTQPGVPNVYGVVGGKANEIQPGKRMLSSMTPTIVINGGEVEMVIGTPGGSTIFTSVFQAITNVVDFSMTAEQAVSASRFHHQLLPPDLVTMSISLPLPESTQAELTERGYRVEPHGWEFGDLQMILRHNGQTSAASDPRGIGEARVIIEE